MAKQKEIADADKLKQLIRENPGKSCRELWASLNPIGEAEFRDLFNQVANEGATHGDAAS
ncbi:MAG TPA: hypothetical protein VLA12_22985 [Planctomycetaceae bacterium]|nr:hypothetical protein [Planctomycetaceae bacterium]